MKGEGLLHVVKHVIKQSIPEASLLKLSSVPVHGLLVGLEGAVKMSLLMGLVLRVSVGVELGVKVSVMLI